MDDISEDNITATSGLLSETRPENEKSSRKSTGEVHYSFDDMLEELGEMGKYQIITYILVCFPVLFAAANSMSYLFVAGEVDYRCEIPYCDSASNLSLNQSWLQNAIPQSTLHPNKLSQCEHYKPVSNIGEIFNGTCSKNLFNSEEIIRCDKWVHNNEENTIMNEWNLYCDQTWKLPFVGTMHFSGIVAGSAVFGFLADTFGRKKLFILAIALMSISGVGQVLCTNYNAFIVLIFINALGTSGVYPLAFILGVELVGKKKREFTGICLNYFYALGECFIGLVAWQLKDWKWIQMGISAPPIIFVCYWWLVPESVRWLLASKRTREATIIIQKVAKTNGVVLSDSIKLSLYNEQVKNDGIKKLHNVKSENDTWKCVKEILCSPKMIARFTIVLYIWTANVFTFYGLTINSVNLSGNKYTNFMLTSLAGIPGYTLAWISIQYLGRKVSLCGSLLGCAICSIIVIFVPKEIMWLEIVSYLLAKMFVTASTGIGYIYTAELLPTIIRSGGVGTASTVSRCGAIIAPFVPFIYPSYEYFPMVLFAIIAGVASLFSVLLPETLGKQLPETIQQAKKL